MPLPALVQDFEHAGLRVWSEDALRLLEPSWLQGVSENRGYLQCQGYGQLQAARRRFVIGTELANRLNFWSRPASQEPWLWRCVYPNPFGDIVQRYSATWDVSPALVYAVMRQESGFHTTIRSPAQATGLMQIIEPTALRIAAELGEPAQVERLQSPRDNIRFGIFYLRKLLALFDEHPAPAVAAYNAGPAAALRWHNAAKAMPVEMFIARIPYEETRTYVQKVLGNLQVYESLYPQYTRLEVPLTLGSNTEQPEASQNVAIDADLY
jgi:soluble lytic murein transglycosylase-like protein